MPAALISFSLDASSLTTNLSISAGGHRHRIDRELLHFGLHRRRRQNLHGCRVEFLDDVARRLGRHEDRVPDDGIGIDEAGFARRRHVRQVRRARWRRDQQRQYAAVANVRQRRRDRTEIEVDATTQQIGQRLCAALVGNVGCLEVGGEPEALRADMRRGAEAGRAVIDRAGLGLGRRDEVLGGLPAFSTAIRS